MADIMLMQNKKEFARIGDIVINGTTNGCGLVVAFDETGDLATCYHWPGLVADNEGYQEKFRKKCGKMDSSVSRIFIITNDFPSDADRQNYQNYGRIIRDMYNVETHYYYRSGNHTGDPRVRICADKTLEFPEPNVAYVEMNL